MLMRTLARAILAAVTLQERTERETAELYALNFFISLGTLYARARLEEAEDPSTPIERKAAIWHGFARTPAQHAAVDARAKEWVKRQYGPARGQA